MPEIDQQISGMFQKFALSFKSKAIEFFSDDSSSSSSFTKSDSYPTQIQNPDSVSVNKLDSYPTQTQNPDRVLVNKPESYSTQTQNLDGVSVNMPDLYSNRAPDQNPDGVLGKIKDPNDQFNQTLITSLFATISSFEASYLQLQTAHVPKYDVDAIAVADKALVSHLNTLYEFKQLYNSYYQNPNFNVEFSTGSCLEFQVNENQHKLRALKSVFNRLQFEIDGKDDEEKCLRERLNELEKVNSCLSKRLGLCWSGDDDGGGGGGGGVEVLLSVKVFSKCLGDVFGLCHKFSKCLVGLMRNAGWDLDLAARAVYSDVGYVKKGHNRFALLSYVCLRMFLGFDLTDFGLCGDAGGSDDQEKVCLKELKEHVGMNPMEILRKYPECDFSRFCELKYQQLIHPTMESSIFRDLDQNQSVISSWKSLGVFYELFVRMASSVWTLHKLAFSFDPPVDIFQVERGVEFSMVYMEDVTRRCTFPCKTRPIVGFTVVPGFKIGRTIIQSQVYLTNSKSTME